VAGGTSRVLFRDAMRWEAEPSSASPDSEAPAPRAYHSLTAIPGGGDDEAGSFVVLGGYDGVTTFADAWWLQLERPTAAPPLPPSPPATAVGNAATVVGVVGDAVGVRAHAPHHKPAHFISRTSVQKPRNRSSVPRWRRKHTISLY
jgi:hypothetical protein